MSNSSPSIKMLAAALAFAGFLPSVPAFLNAADPPAASVAAAFPAGDGLAVQVGAENGAFLADLTNNGKRLVHGLALDEKTRDTVRVALHQRKVYPLASVAIWQGVPALPYADRLINLLIIAVTRLALLAPPVRGNADAWLAPTGSS